MNMESEIRSRSRVRLSCSVIRIARAVWNRVRRAFHSVRKFFFKDIQEPDLTAQQQEQTISKADEVIAKDITDDGSIESVAPVGIKEVKSNRSTLSINATYDFASSIQVVNEIKPEQTQLLSKCLNQILNEKKQSETNLASVKISLEEPVQPIEAINKLINFVKGDIFNRNVTDYSFAQEEEPNVSSFQRVYQKAEKTYAPAEKKHTTFYLHVFDFFIIIIKKG
jgi:hypothetical protein